MEYKILIVDDEPDFIEVMASIIENAEVPYEILNAVNGETACRIAATQLPDLIITDWEMPFMSGIELIERLRKNQSTAKIPVIMCTGMMTSSENLKIALDAGAVDFIRKPIDAIELLARIRSMLVLIDSFAKIRKQREELHLKENELLQSNLEARDKELTTKTLAQIQNQETIISLVKDLEGIREKNKDEAIDKLIGGLIHKLSVNNSEANWEEFRIYFEEVHSNFFKGILAYCPNLTQNEIRICALLRLNFSTKDISSITHQSPRSVDVARYRLRKKLNLSQEDNLTGFLSQF